MIAATAAALRVAPQRAQREAREMLRLAWKNLRRDPGRAVLATAAVTTAVVLVTIELGILLAMGRNASLLIDRSGAELWVSVPRVKTFDFGTPMPARKKQQLRSIPGVGQVEELNIAYSVWRLPDGGNANVQVVALEERGRLAPRLPLIAGRFEALHNQDAVVVDESALGKLGGVGLGDRVEILRNRAQVVGITRGFQSFSTMPFVFTGIRRGPAYGLQLLPTAATPSDLSVYFLIQVVEGYSVKQVQAAVAAAVPEVEVHAAGEFSLRTRLYWLLETGIGIGFLVAAFLGLVVGGAILSQSLYGMTVEKLSEFAVLKALGVGMGELSLMVAAQGLGCGLAGWVTGQALCVLLRLAAAKKEVAIESSPLLFLGSLWLVAGLCMASSWASIARLGRVEPAAVFRT